MNFNFRSHGTKFWLVGVYPGLNSNSHGRLIYRGTKNLVPRDQKRSVGPNYGFFQHIAEGPKPTDASQTFLRCGAMDFFIHSMTSSHTVRKVSRMV